MTTRMNQRGVALLAVLGFILTLLPLAAALCLQTHLDGLMQRNQRGSAQAFYAAEAGMTHALSEIRPSASLRGLLTGPDGVEGTPDDGWFPFRTPAFAGLSYEVRVQTGRATTVSLQSTGHGMHDAVRTLEMIVAPSDAPFTPGALYIEAGAANLDLGSRGFALSGAANDQESPGTEAVPGIAVTSDAAAVALRSMPQSAQVTGAGGAPSVTVAPSLDLASYHNTLRGRLDAVIYPPDPPASMSLGTEASPQLTVIDGNWQMTGSSEGFGILVVLGDLEIESTFAYRGLVVVSGKLRVGESADAHVEGTLWLRNGAGARIDLLGTGLIRYNPSDLRRAGAALEQALLYSTNIAGWREPS